MKRTTIVATLFALAIVSALTAGLGLALTASATGDHPCPSVSQYGGGHHDCDETTPPPTEPTETLPTEPTETLPTEPTEPTPTLPTEPTQPTETLPTEPSETIPATPTEPVTPTPSETPPTSQIPPVRAFDNHTCEYTIHHEQEYRDGAWQDTHVGYEATGRDCSGSGQPPVEEEGM